MKGIHIQLLMLLLTGGMLGQVGLAQAPAAQGWGVGVDASRLACGHAVLHVERVQSSDVLWTLDVGRYIGSLNEAMPCWRDLQGDVQSGHVIAAGVKAFPSGEFKLGAQWFVGADVSRESYNLARLESLLTLENVAGVRQTREEARLMVGAQWSWGRHLVLRAHVGMGVIRDRVSAWAEGSTINSLPIARPGGLELVWRW